MKWQIKLFFPDGGQKIQNIQPFTKRDLEIRGLGDRIRDIDHITYLYPEFPKHDVFRKFYTGNGCPVQRQSYVLSLGKESESKKLTSFLWFEAEPTLSTNEGYIPVSLQLKVGM